MDLGQENEELIQLDSDRVVVGDENAIITVNLTKSILERVFSNRVIERDFLLFH